MCEIMFSRIFLGFPVLLLWMAVVTSPLEATHASSPLEATHASSPLEATHASSPLELNPPRAVVRYGDSVSVNCSTSFTDLEGMGWEATLGGISFKPDVNIVTWTVDNLTDWTIKAVCYKTLTNNDQKEAVLPVILYKTPDSVSISPLSHSGPMVEGTKYQLQCDIQNVAPLRNLVVKWYKGDEPLDNVTYSNVIKTPEDVSATLMITPSRDDDGAQYRCVAELDLGPDGPQPHPTVTSEPLKITVHYKPVIECPSQYSGVEEDSTLDMIPCTFNGNPPPNAVWYKEGRPVNASAPLARTDSGQYVIITTNDIGSTNSTVHITVEYPPTFSRPEAETLDISVGEEITLNCTATGRPTPIYSWQPSHAQEALFNLSSEFPGTYTCTASNLIGNNSKTFTVNLKPKGYRKTFYVILGLGLGLAVLVIIIYLVVKRKAGLNSVI